MSAHHSYRYLFLFLLLVSWQTDQSEAQSADSSRHFLALDLTQDQNATFSIRDLENAASYGISLLLISPESLTPETVDQGFSFILFSGNSYSSVGQLRSESAEFIANLHRNFDITEQAYPENIAAIELFRYPNDVSSRFFEISEIIIDSVRTFTDVPLFYTSAASGYRQASGPFSFIAREAGVHDIESYEFTPYVHFKPSENLRASLNALDRLLDIHMVPDNSVIVLPSSWLSGAVESVPGLATVLNLYTTGERIPMPLPAETKAAPAANWSVLILILIWISFVLHFRFQPVYAQSFSRYFTHHQFYIDDVIEHRVRNATPGLIVLFQHSVITALFIYVSASILISDTGLGVLQAHFPGLFLFQNPLFSLSFAGFSIALLLKTISILWIYILNRELTNFSQVLNLYSWPIHLNLLTVTLLVVLSQVGITGFSIAILSGFFAFTWFMSFNMAAMDAARFLKSRIIYLILTVGIHVLLVMFAIWYIYNSPFIYEPLQMAFSF